MEQPPTRSRTPIGGYDDGYHLEEKKSPVPQAKLGQSQQIFADEEDDQDEIDLGITKLPEELRHIATQLRSNDPAVTKLDLTSKSMSETEAKVLSEPILIRTIITITITIH